MTAAIRNSQSHGSAASRSNHATRRTRRDIEPLERRTLLSANLLWHPQPGSNAWDYTTANWLDTATNQPAVFHDGDNVTFDDSGGGGTVSVVSTGVSPGSTTDDSTLDYVLQSATVNEAPGINGAGGLIKHGSGTLTFFYITNSYSGPTDVQGGTLALNWGTLGNGAGTVTVEQGAALEIITPRAGPPLSNPLVLNGSGVGGSGALLGAASPGGYGYWNGPITVATASLVNSGQGSMDLTGSIEDDAGLTLDGDSDFLIEGAVTGPGGITKNGSGTAYFDGPGKTYSGATLVNSGTLRDGGGASGELSPNSRYTVAAGATLQDYGFDTIGSLTGAGTVVPGPGGPITVGADNSDFTFSGVITDGTLIKIGTGSWTIGGDQPNVFHSLQIGEPGLGDGGTVVLDKPDGVTAVGSNPADPGNGITIYSGNLIWAGSNQLLPGDPVSTVGNSSGTANVDLGGHTDTINSLAFGSTGTFHIGAGGTLNVVNFAFTNTAPVTWTIDPGGTMNFLDGGAGYGSLNGGRGARLAFGGGSGSGAITLNLAGTINIGNSQGVAAAGFGGGTTINVMPTGRLNTGSGAVVVVTNGFDVQGGGQLNLGQNGDNASLEFFGSAISCTLTLESGSSLNLLGAGAEIDNEASQAAIVGGGTIDLGGADRTIHCAGGTLSVTSDIVNGAITKDGAGDLSLAPTAANTYGGATDVQGGTVYLGIAAIPDDSALTIDPGATVIDNGQSAVRNNAYATIGSIAGGGTLELHNGNWSLFVGADNTSTDFSGAIIGGFGSLTKIGAGTLTLSGDQPDTFHDLRVGQPAPDGSIVSGGTVVLDKANGMPAVGYDSSSAVNGVNVYGGSLIWAADNQFLPADVIGMTGSATVSANFDLGGHTDTLKSLQLGYGAYHIGSGGALNLADSAVGFYPATWNIDDGGTLNLLDGGGSYGGVRLGLSHVTVNLSGTINIGNSPDVPPADALGVSSGFASKAAAIFQSGTVTVTATGRINTGAGSLAIVVATVDVQSGGQINLGEFGDGAALEFAGYPQARSGLLDIESGATVNLLGSNSQVIDDAFSPNAIIGGGTLNLDGQNRTFAIGGTLVVSASISNGFITKTGSVSYNVLDLAGSNTFNGPTTVQQGTLLLGSADALSGTPHVYVDDGGALDLNGYELTVPLDIQGSGDPYFGNNALGNFQTNNFWGLPTGPGPAIITSTVTLNAMTKISDDGLGITFAGPVTGPGGISVGAGGAHPIFVHGGNDYSGGTTDADRTWGGTSFEVAAPNALGSGPLHLDGSLLIFDSATDEVTASSVTLASAISGYLPNLVINGPAPADAYTLINDTGADPVAGTFNGLPQGASLVVGGKTFYINYQGGDGNDVVISTAPPGLGSIQGMVWVDFNNDGNVDFGEQGIAGVPITLTGSAGNVVAQTTTDADGLYTFGQLPPDLYTITEGADPAGYVEGRDSLGTITDLQGDVIRTGAGNASVQDVFSAVPLGTSQNAINYNFGELPAPGSAVSKGQAATMGFWQNKNGQALILQFASIGPWLAATLPQTFGGLAGASPQQVATLYQQKFVLTDKLDAQAMATALSVYATDASLGGAAAASYGFSVGAYGLGDSTWNIGADGAAFNVANNSTLTVLQILQDWDQQTNKTDKTIRHMAIDVFGGINSKGGI
jgi:fibronectin-binding autotransporter adhesin